MVHSEKGETDSIEAEIVKWILMKRSLEIAVSSWEIIIKACNLKEYLYKKLLFALKMVLSISNKKPINLSFRHSCWNSLSV